MESLNRLFDVFSRERRRYALYELDRADGPVELEDLAERIKEREENEDHGESDGFDEVVLSLEHVHLPRAAEAEYVEFDREANEIRISGRSAEFKLILTVSEAIEDSDSTEIFDPDNTTPEELLTRLSPTSEAGD